MKPMASSWQETQPPSDPPDHDDHQDHYQNKEVDEEGEEWLQLGLGLNSSRPSSTRISCKSRPQHHRLDDHEIFMDVNSSNQNIMMRMGISNHLHVGPSNYPAPHDDDDHHHAAGAATGNFVGVECGSQIMADPVISHNNSISQLHSSSTTTPTPTPTPNSGLWFTLRSSINRELGEQGQALPQIPKANIRVKDENVTIFMVKKYLVRKLGLSNEAEIDIWCMGQNLMHTQTLKQVRDGVWLPKLIQSVNSAAASASFHDDEHFPVPLTFSNHLMSLHYGRRHFFN